MAVNKDNQNESYCHHESEPHTASYLNASVLKHVGARSQKILEVGCGNGSFAELLLKYGHQVHGIDVSESGITIAKKRGLPAKFTQFSVYENFSHLGEGEFDAVIGMEVIEHLFDPKTFLQNAFDSLVPSGRLVLTTPYHGYWKNLAISLTNGWDKHFSVDWHGGHIKFFSFNTLRRELTNAGFCSIQFEGAGRFPYLWKSMICVAHKPAK